MKERKINMYKEKITELLLSTNREGMDKLVEHMENGGFFTAPCSTRYHLSKEGGLAEHSLNVYENALRISGGLGRPEEVLRDSLIIVSLLHDLGKMGQFGKENYVPNMLKGRATKVNPDPEPKQSEAQPYKSNPDLLYVDHEVRSIAIASRNCMCMRWIQKRLLSWLRADLTRSSGCGVTLLSRTVSRCGRKQDTEPKESIKRRTVFTLR